jgi:hypothetical protein
MKYFCDQITNYFQKREEEKIRREEEKNKKLFGNVICHLAILFVVRILYAPSYGRQSYGRHKYYKMINLFDEMINKLDAEDFCIDWNECIICNLNTKNKTICGNCGHTICFKCRQTICYCPTCYKKFINNYHHKYFKDDYYCDDLDYVSERLKQFHRIIINSQKKLTNPEIKLSNLIATFLAVASLKHCFDLSQKYIFRLANHLIKIEQLKSASQNERVANFVI